MNSTTELVKDIFAYALLLIRLGYDKCVTNRTIFIEMLNEAFHTNGSPAFRTVTGKEFTVQSFHIMISRLPQNVKQDLLEEFGDALQSLTFQGTSPLAPENWR